MEDAYIDQFGPTLYELFFQRYSEKVWGLPCDQMSGDWVSQRSKGMSLVTAVKDAVVPSKGKVVSLIDEFMYPRVRLRPLLRADGRRASPAMGNEIRLGTGVERVHRDGNRVVGVTVRTDKGTERIEAANFISSIPLTLLAKIIDPAAPADVLAAADTLTFRNIITVNLMLKKRQVTPDTWLYVHDRNILFGRFHEPKNWSPAMVPSDDVHVAGRRVLLLLRRSHLEHDRGAAGRADGQAPGRRPGASSHRDEVIGGFIVRAPRAYPSYVIGYEKPLDKIKAFIDELENLQIIGRVRHVPVQQHRSLDRDRSAGRQEHPRRAPRSRSGQRRQGVPRDQAGARKRSAVRERRASPRLIAARASVLCGPARSAPRPFDRPE